MAAYKRCRAEIVFVLTPAGKHMPCDPPIVAVVTELGNVVKGRVPHWATCPHAGEFRSR